MKYTIMQHQPQLSDLMCYNDYDTFDLDDYINFSDKTPLSSYRTYRIPILHHQKNIYNTLCVIHDNIRPISSYKERKYNCRKYHHPVSSQYLILRGGSL